MGIKLLSTGGGSVTLNAPSIENDIELTVPLSSIIQGNSSVAVTDTGSNGTVAITTEGTERMRIDASGNVGIGTSSPERKLDVRGALQSYGESGDSFNAAVSAVEYGTKSPYLSLYKTRGSKSSPTNTLPGDNIGFIYFGGYNSVIGGSDSAAYSSIRVIQMGDATANGTPHDLSFNVNSGSAQYGSERMRITSDGNVGIGTSSPAQLVEIKSNNAYFDDYSSATYDQNVELTGPANEYPHFSIKAWGGAASGGSATPFQEGEITLLRQRGTLSSPLPTQNGDGLGAFVTRGWNSTLNDYSGCAILGQQTGAATATGTPTALFFFTNNGSNVNGTFNFEITATGDALVKGAGGLGYGTGTGGSVTQASSRTTGVTLNKTNGQITLVSAAGTTTAASFTVTNSTVAATDTIIVNQATGANLYDIMVTAVAAGSFRITQRTTGGTTTEAPIFNFAVIKAVTS